MLNMERSSVNLLDLPSEMLFNILEKLDNVDILYSLLGINNERLHNIVREKTFSNTLNFTSIDYDTTRIESILNRFCIYILPQIHDNIKCLIVEPAVSMERILLTTHYPNLTELKIVNFQLNSPLNYFTGKQILGISSIERLQCNDIKSKQFIGCLTTVILFR
jgi:hypothetical protein